MALPSRGRGALALGLVGLAAALRLWVFTVVRVSTATLQMSAPEGTWLLVNRLRAPEVGELVVVRPPDEDALLVRRLVARGPAEVELVDGVLHVDGQAVGEPAGSLRWLEPDCSAAQGPAVQERAGGRAWTVLRAGEHPPEPLAPGALWVLTDRRTARADSRQWGPLGAGELVGVVEWELVRPRGCGR